MDEQAAQYEPDEVTYRIFGGGWCRVEEAHITLLADDGAVARTVNLSDVVSVRRGGPDLTLVRRDADPISLTMAMVEHARQVEGAVEAIITAEAEQQEADNPARRRWKFWQHS